MADINHIQLIGYLTEDIEVRDLQSGMQVTDLNIQVKSQYLKDGGEKAYSTSFHTVTVWGQSAGFLSQYARRGSQVYVSGRLKTDSWEDNQGKKRYKTKVVADAFGGVILLDPKTPLAPIEETYSVSGGLNRVDALGNITKDLELRKTPGGRSVVNFSIATNRTWKDKESGEKKEEAEFHNIVAWGDLAEDAEKILKKGHRVFISGALTNRSWETPTGEKRYTTEIIADEVHALGHTSESLAEPRGKDAGGENDVPRESSAGGDSSENIPEIQYTSEIKPEDLPF